MSMAFDLPGPDLLRVRSDTVDGVCMRYGYIPGGSNRVSVDDVINQILIPAAYRMSPYGNHYKDKPTSVGAAALGLMPPKITGNRQNWVILTGNNMKTAPGDDFDITERCCAEEAIFEKAYILGCTSLEAIAVASEPMIDDTSGLQTATIEPCRPCRVRFNSSPLVNGEVQVVTLDVTSPGRIVRQTVQEIYGKHTYYPN
jgi:cytidine deaminase